MELKLTNKTADPQQVMLCNGEAITVLPGKEQTIDLGAVFTEEIKRIGKFFDIEEIVPAKKEYIRPTKIETIALDKNEGGNE